MRLSQQIRIQKFVKEHFEVQNKFYLYSKMEIDIPISGEIVGFSTFLEGGYDRPF